MQQYATATLARGHGWGLSIGEDLSHMAAHRYADAEGNEKRQRDGKQGSGGHCGSTSEFLGVDDRVEAVENHQRKQAKQGVHCHDGSPGSETVSAGSRPVDHALAELDECEEREPGDNQPDKHKADEQHEVFLPRCVHLLRSTVPARCRSRLTQITGLSSCASKD